MAASLCGCLRLFMSGGITTNKIPNREQSGVKLDPSHAGQDVVIVKNGRRICGSGAALSNAPIVQNKAYFEVKIQSSGSWAIGLATRKCNINKLPLGEDAESWVLKNDGNIFHKNEQIATLTGSVEEGDILGFTFDHIDFNIYLNGRPTGCSIHGIKGTTFPIFYVDEGAIMDIQFVNFFHEPPEGFERIMIEQSLL